MPVAVILLKSIFFRKIAISQNLPIREPHSSRLFFLFIFVSVLLWVGAPKQFIADISHFPLARLLCSPPPIYFLKLFSSLLNET